MAQSRDSTASPGAPDWKRLVAVYWLTSVVGGLGVSQVFAYLAPYLRTPAYQAGWALQGFDEADWAKPGSDRLADAMVAWGDVEALRARVAELVAAGADHVALIPLSPEGVTENLAVLEAMAAD